MDSIKFRRTNVAGRVPTPSQLGEGELAINMVDKKLFSVNRDGEVIVLGGSNAEYELKTANFTCVSGGHYAVRTNTVSIVATLPSSPKENDFVVIGDAAGRADNYPIKIAGFNGDTLVMNRKSCFMVLTYITGKWTVTDGIGESGVTQTIPREWYEAVNGAVNADGSLKAKNAVTVHKDTDGDALLWFENKGKTSAALSTPGTGVLNIRAAKADGSVGTGNIALYDNGNLDMWGGDINFQKAGRKHIVFKDGTGAVSGYVYNDDNGDISFNRGVKGGADYQLNNLGLTINNGRLLLNRPDWPGLDFNLTSFNRFASLVCYNNEIQFRTGSEWMCAWRFENDAYSMQLRGRGYASGGFHTGSDARFKENITYSHTRQTKSALDKVLAIPTASFNYREGKQNCFGFIAQDVEFVFPEAVSKSKQSTNSDTGEHGEERLFLDPMALIALQAEAIKELTARVEALENNNG